MTSRFPKDPDAFRAIADGFEEMTRTVVTDLFDALIAIETELGANPSSDSGAIDSRLFGTGNLSEQSGAWAKMFQQTVSAGTEGFSLLQPGVVFNYVASRYSGQDTIFGTGAPALFFQLNFPITITKVPWVAFITRYDTFFSAVTVGTNQDLLGTTEPVCQVALLWWNLYTGGNPIAEE